MGDSSKEYVLAFDTANEVVSIGVGRLDCEDRSIEAVASEKVSAHRASNTLLLPRIDALLASCGVSRDELACVCVGRGPGSFTGVRIALATAKGISSALGCALIGVSSLDVVAWNVWSEGRRGRLLVLGDAMRKEVYPAWFQLNDEGVDRNSADTVVKAEAFATGLPDSSDVLITGDALHKYADLLQGKGELLPENEWTPTGVGLLLAFQHAWRAGAVAPFDSMAHNPGKLLPVYTRLSDAEENERERLAQNEPRNLRTGVQDSRATMHSQSGVGEFANEHGVIFMPLDSAHADEVAALESELMGTDAWTSRMVADELPHKDRTWWRATDAQGETIGYAGALAAADDMQLLKIAVAPEYRRSGIAAQLFKRTVEDARNLGARTASLEVRASNGGAIAFYRALGFTDAGVRPKYYSDGEDALIMQTSIDENVFTNAADADCSDRTPSAEVHPLILAIESSCDETAAAVVDGSDNILSDVVASQVDFHARFGGVVPEIASRKHIEAICGVCDQALDDADNIRYKDLDAIAVTYAPGLVGALVVGVAFAKGAAWALDVPFIGVNHLEGHLYANKLAESFAPPAVVSLVSGGNTMLVYMRDWGSYEVLGYTIDDAVGEAFDKVAKALGLPYPGGPHISKLAAEGNPEAIDFPRAMLHSGDLRFSLSGLKTAVTNYIYAKRTAGEELNMPDICASFEAAVIDVQVAKAKTALEQTGAPTFCVGGGVAANPELRAAYEKMCSQIGVRLVMPPLSACGDNAAMIALVAADRFRANSFFGLDADAYAHADISEPY